MKIDLTKSQCESLIDFIECNLLDVIRNDTDIDNLEWVKNILNANTIFHLAIAESKKPKEMHQEAPEELTENEMTVAIEEACDNFPGCYDCPLANIPGKCVSEGASIQKNYSIMKEAGLFDQKEG